MAAHAVGLTVPAQIDKWIDSVVPREMEGDANTLRNQIRKNTSQIKKENTVEFYYAARNLELQYLVRRFISQLRYGCQSLCCRQKLCLTWREIFARHPVRRPSHITARIMAYTLATGDDPYRKLCSEKSTLVPEDLDLGADLQDAIRERLPITSLRFAYTLYVDEPQNDEVFCVKDRDPQWYRTVTKKDQVLQINHPSQSQALWDYWKNSLDMDGKPRLDRKSLQQKLFSSSPVKIFEWYPVVRELSMMQKLLGVKDGIIVGRTATALPLNVSDAEIARSISPQFPGTAQPIKAAVLSDDALDYFEIPLPLKLPSPNSHPDLKGSDEAQPEASPARVENATSLPKDSPEESESIPEHSRKPINHSRYKANVVVDPKASEYELMTPSEFTDRCAPPTYPQVPAQVQFGLTELTVHCVGLHGQKFVEQAGLTELTWVTFLALRNTCINAIPTTCFGPGRPEDIDPVLWQYTSNSLFQGLGTRRGLLRSFPEPRNVNAITPWRIIETFHWHRFAPDIILSYLWHGIEDLFIPPPTSTRKKRYKNGHKRGLNKRDQTDQEPSAPQYVEDSDAAHMIMICIYALAGSVKFLTREVPVWNLVNDDWMSNGRFLDSSKTFAMLGQTPAKSEEITDLIDAFHSEAALRLASRLVKAIGARRCFFENKAYPRGGGLRTAYHRQTTFPLMNIVLQNLVRIEDQSRPQWSSRSGFRVAHVFINWMRMVFMQNWDGQPQLNRWDVAGAALEIMSETRWYLPHLQVRPGLLKLKFMTRRIDMIESVIQYAQHTPSKNVLHLLQCHFLFTPKQIIQFFRTLSYLRLSDAHRHVGYMQAFTERVTFAPDRSQRNYLNTKLKKALSRYLVLDVRREHVLEDTMNQLWGKEKRELLRPLKVRMGMDEGEAGIDHGGVSQEFFRVVFQKAFDPDTGLFVTDPDSKMTWFRPMSLEPLSTYELLGLIMSIGIYNGITLPTSFPWVFYAKILGRRIDGLDRLKDGWPGLVKGFEQLIDWKDGDVQDVFTRDYVFSYEANGQTYHVDMLDEALMSEPCSALPDAARNTDSDDFQPVTNENRAAFVQDYVLWLTERSIAPQFEAFQRGFSTCLDEKALSLVSPETLQFIAEGHHDFSIDELEEATLYEEGYYADHHTIMAFWHIVKSYPKEKQAKLLEFVTASSRVPVNGVSALHFSIVRNGPDSDLIPRSQTCFGKLLIPEYSSVKKLQEKLDIALEHSVGFGSI